MSCHTGPAVRKTTALIAERIAPAISRGRLPRMSDQRPKQIRATITPAAYTAKMIVVVVTPKPRSFA